MEKRLRLYIFCFWALLLLPNRGGRCDNFKARPKRIDKWKDIEQTILERNMRPGSFSSPLRRLFFAHGAKIVIESSLTVPVLHHDAFGVGSDFTMALPITIHLDKLNLASWSDLQNKEYDIEWGRIDDVSKLRLKRSTNSSLNSSYDTAFCRDLAAQKIAIFKKLEGFYYSISPKAATQQNNNDCFLRTLCQMYAASDTAGQQYGVLGDLFKELLRIDQFESLGCDKRELKSLKPYIKARNDAKRNQCDRYSSQSACPNGIF